MPKFCIGVTVQPGSTVRGFQEGPQVAKRYPVLWQRVDKLGVGMNQAAILSFHWDLWTSLVRQRGDRTSTSSTCKGPGVSQGRGGGVGKQDIRLPPLTVDPFLSRWRDSSRAVVPRSGAHSLLMFLPDIFCKERTFLPTLTLGIKSLVTLMAHLFPRQLLSKQSQILELQVGTLKFTNLNQVLLLLL